MDLIPVILDKTWAVVVIMTNNIKIISTIILPNFTKIKDLYKNLADLKKDKFDDNERIIFEYNPIDIKIIELVNNLLYELDIPIFFVTFKENSNLALTELDFIPSNTHCFYAFNNLSVSNQGEIKPCCLYKGKINGNGKFIQNSDLLEVYNSPYMISLRSQFINNQRPSGCSTCWDIEDSGGVSMRQAAKYKFKELYYNVENNTIKVLDLKMGNACNLSCRICNEESSSSIAKIKYNTGLITEKKFISLQQNNWTLNDTLIEGIIDKIKNVQHIDLYGGEPLMNKSHFKLLKKLIDLGLSKEISLEYSSNGSFYSESFFKIWDYFKTVKISFSIDDIGERFELQRNGLQWSKLENNIKKFSLKQSDKFIIDIFPTISIYNVLYLPELLEWSSNQNFSLSPILNNFVNYPTYLSINNVTHEAKQIILKKLKEHNNNIVSLDHIINMLENTQSKDTNVEFIKYTKMLDSQRSQNFLDTHYEIAMAMGFKN